VIPIGAGVGEVWVFAAGTGIHVFAEPQWTIIHDGVGQPQFQSYAGVNLQFSIHK
jgi:hypothetical protein